MQRLSITQAWNETAEFAKRDFGALFAVSMALIAFPTFALQALGSRRAAAAAESGAGLWLLLALLVVVLTITGSVAISALALRRENVVGRAIAHGFRRMPAMLGASALVGLAAGAVLVAIVLAMHVDLEALSARDPAAVGRVSRAFLLFLLLFLPFWVRLMMMTPVAAAEPAGPVALIRRSWALTRGHFWKLLGFTLLMAVVLIVISLVATTMVGLVVTLLLGRPEPGNFSELLLLLVGAVVNAAVTVFLTTMVARIYVQLSGGEAGGAAVGAVDAPGSGGTTGS